MSKILEALGTLDPENDEHWTADGLPRIEAVEAATGNKGMVRKDITNAAPDFTRESARASASRKPESRGTGTPPGDPMGWPLVVLARHPDEMRKLLDRLTAEAREQRAIKDAAVAKLARITAQSETINRLLARVSPPPDRNAAMGPIRDYLTRQARVREERRARMEGILAPGVKPADLAKALDPRAPVDVRSRAKPAGK